MVIVKILVSIFIFAVGWKMVKLREPEYSAGIPETRKRFSCGVAILYMLLATCAQHQETWHEAILHSLFWASMSLCAWCDYMTTEVYDFLYLPALLSGSMLLYICDTGHILPDVVVFVVIHILLFRKLFGASDCIAFCICALYMAGFGKRIEAYIWLMLYVHLIFMVVQLLTGNISRKFRLKKSKPLIPYIAITILLMGT